MCGFRIVLQIDLTLTHRQLTLDRQQTSCQNSLGIKEQPDKPYQITEEFINNLLSSQKLGVGMELNF
jgi:hypothetical protein